MYTVTISDLLQALQHGAEASSSDDDDAEPANLEPTYAQEQQQLKQQFLQVWQ